MRRPPPVAVPDPVDVTSGPLPDPRRVAPRRRSDLGHGTGMDSLINSIKSKVSPLNVVHFPKALALRLRANDD